MQTARKIVVSSLPLRDPTLKVADSWRAMFVDCAQSSTPNGRNNLRFQLCDIEVALLDLWMEMLDVT